MEHVTSVAGALPTPRLVGLLGFLWPPPGPGPPVRMFLKASSTLVESKAEVSMKDKLFFSRTDRILPR